jgi:hypothetical protein
MKITVSSRRQTVLSAESRQVDRGEKRQELNIERRDRSNNLAARRPARRNVGVVGWLLACPAKGYFAPIESD